MTELNGETPMESPTAPLTEENTSLEAMKAKMVDLENQVKEKEAKYVYLYADFENFKKRSIKERSDLARYGNESFARDLLQVLDNLERALQHISPGPNSDGNLAQGLKMVLDQFANTFDQYGIRPIDTHKKTFDPNLHEAIEKEQSELPEGTILKEMMKGYTIHGRLLRPSRVVVSDGIGEKTP